MSAKLFCAVLALSFFTSCSSLKTIERGLSSPSETRADGVVGNGGSACVNGDEVKFLDLLTSRYKINLKSDGSYEDELAKYTDRLNEVVPFLGTIFKNSALDLMSKAKIDNSMTLAISNDSPFGCPEGYKRKQLALFVEEKYLYINKGLLDKLTNTEIAALAIHEAYYWLDRHASVTPVSSNSAREFTSILFSEETSKEMLLSFVNQNSVVSKVLEKKFGGGLFSLRTLFDYEKDFDYVSSSIISLLAQDNHSIEWDKDSLGVGSLYLVRDISKLLIYGWDHEAIHDVLNKYRKFNEKLFHELFYGEKSKLVLPKVYSNIGDFYNFDNKFDEILKILINQDFHSVPRLQNTEEQRKHVEIDKNLFTAYSVILKRILSKAEGFENFAWSNVSSPKSIALAQAKKLDSVLDKDGNSFLSKFVLTQEDISTMDNYVNIVKYFKIINPNPQSLYRKNDYDKTIIELSAWHKPMNEFLKCMKESRNHSVEDVAACDKVVRKNNYKPIHLK